MSENKEPRLAGLEFRPARFATDSPRTRISPVLTTENVEKAALAGLKVWINGVDVTPMLGELAALSESDLFPKLSFTELNFGPGAHHLRASLPDEANGGLAVADAFFEAAGARAPQAVLNAAGEQVVPKKKCKCCDGDGGGGGGNDGDGDGDEGGRECDKMNGGEPVDEDEGGPPPAGPTPDKPDCRIKHINLTPGLVAKADLEKVVIDVLTEPADANVEFSDEVRVRFEVPPSLMFNYTDKNIGNITRAELARQRGARIFRVRGLGPGFHRIVGPRKAELLISQIDLQTRALGGVAFQASIGVRCPGGRWTTIVVGINDPG